MSPTGYDSDPGSVTAPKRSIGAAIAAAPSGGTVVLRGGTYHESVTIPSGKAVTVQSYPGEVVWMDGTRGVSGFVQGSVGWAAPWNVRLDSSPTFTWGAPDSTTQYWQFVNPSYPMAAHPDMVWLGGVQQRQVGSLSQLVPGTFYVDQGSALLYLGSDPSGQDVRSSDLPRAFNIAAADVTIRGIGVRRFASSVPHQGVITARGASFRLENVVVDDSATGAVGVFGVNSVLDHVSIARSGQLGVQGHQVDNLRILSSSITESNNQSFNQMPAAGGIKLTSSRYFELRNSVVSGGTGNGVWMDMSCYDMTLVNNRVSDNSGRGIFLEVSSVATVAGNLLTNNNDEGFVARGTDRVKLWNNTIIGTTKAIDFSKDSRNQSNSASCRDTRRPFPDPEMPWTIGNSSVGDNVIQSGKAFLSVEDWTHVLDASSAGFQIDGNLYSAPVAPSPWWMIVWARAGTDPAVYDSPATFTTQRGQDANSRLIRGASAVGSSFSLTPTASSMESSVAQPLPADVAAKLGREPGSRHLGYWP
ncbi:right-handed parallel beta-helix repeat-containing protein [Pedococcus sp. KACC 23699]|uniref:Right-handed parallel beta-helix repeat-containing protein n=1 Tax=Pedococcus sp. KACC 23699 TaxID=3149228 RepID=A0AAU7JWR3_9MICO